MPKKEIVTVGSAAPNPNATLSSAISCTRVIGRDARRAGACFSLEASVSLRSQNRS